MTEIEKARLFDVTGPVDKPAQSGGGIPVQFNPSSLKVTLANSLKENERSGNSRATQYVDKSSSSLSVELIFDTTMDWEGQSGRQNSKSGKHKDVRQLTKEIAKAYMFQPKVGDKNTAPKRCMFVWGTFAFVGVMESFDETLDFFAPEGTPLRSTVSIKMTESRFQFETREAKVAKRNTPRLGSGSDPVPSNWRDNAMYNGQESPRMPSDSAMSIPSAGLAASIGGGLSGGIGMTAGVSGGMGSSAGVSFSAVASVSGGLSSSTPSITTPGFHFGSSSALGSSIPGAFSASISGNGLTAGGIVAANANSTRGSLFAASAGGRSATGRVTASANATISPSGGVKASGGVGFD